MNIVQILDAVQSSGLAEQIRNSLFVFEFTSGRSSDKWDRGTTPTGAKLAGVLSLLLWISVVFFGRWIGFTTTGNPAPVDDFQIPDIFK
jgi:hypothetical protein